MLGQLVPVGGGDPIPLLKSQLLIGRRSSCDIVLDFPNVSSQHCELAFINGFWQIRDLGSSNGIKVNGERLDSKFLQPGDMISVAKHQFTINFAPGAAAPPQEEEDPFQMSLLEKAGLEKRRDDARQARRSAPPSKPSAQKFSLEEDEATRWLTGDE
jgi:pSer/pThr/pTyr-binding forkhead associated (FHA) protein